MHPILLPVDILHTVVVGRVQSKGSSEVQKRYSSVASTVEIVYVLINAAFCSRLYCDTLYSYVCTGCLSIAIQVSADDEDPGHYHFMRLFSSSNMQV